MQTHPVAIDLREDLQALDHFLLLERVLVGVFGGRGKDKA